MQSRNDSIFVKLWSPTRKYFSSILEMLEPELYNISLIRVPSWSSIVGSRIQWQLREMGLFPELEREAEEDGVMFIEFFTSLVSKRTGYRYKDVLKFEKKEDKVLCTYACIRKESLHNYTLYVPYERLAVYNKVHGISKYELDN